MDSRFMAISEIATIYGFGFMIYDSFRPIRRIHTDTDKQR